MGAHGQFARTFGRRFRLLLAAPVWVYAMSAIPASAVELDPDTIVLTSRVFDIPFRMDEDSNASFVRLYVSSDRGKSWTMVSQQPLPVELFHFEAVTDGEFWFTHATDLDTIGDPVAELSPERKIYIDSNGPSIDLDASADLDGKLSATLKLSDPHDIATLRVLYATDVVRSWVAVQNQSIDAEGRFSIQPDQDWRQMSVHVTAEDTIGNVSVQSKMFRRPRMAATKGPRLAEHSKPLRVQTAAGPGDPPTFLLGPAGNGANQRGSTPATSAANTAAANAALQSPGSGPLQLPDTGMLRDTTTQRSTPKPLDRLGEDRSLQSFGSAFGDLSPTMQFPPNPRPQPATALPKAQPRPAPRQSAAPGDNRPRTLPASGLTAKVTPEGIEVLPAPTPEPETAPQLPASGPEMSLPPPASPAAEQPTGETSANGVTPAPTASDVPTQTSGRPRTLEEAMRPIAPSPDLSPTPQATAPVPETIPTPAPSRTSPDATETQDERRYRAERAEQLNREQQQRYDRAQLARSVPIRWSNSNRFSLEYELEAVGASGVEAVELYGSTDAGRNWKRWGADPDRTSPFDIETKGEGVFAFRIVVLGNNGLSSPRPLPGDNPDIAVIVDQTLPTIKISSARYGEGDRTGSLVIRYECSDENLMNRPVSIAFSDSIDGPWTTIAAGLRNDGLYVWPADPKLPPAIYLRVDATDQAGNTGSYLLDQPIATGGLAPRARILGFRSR